MALQTFECPHGHRFDAITGSTIKDNDAQRCPVCASPQLKTIIAAPHGDFRGNGQITIDECRKRGDLETVIKNKQWMEAHSEQILSGELGIKENGPKEMRPQCPEHLRKRLY